MPWSITCTEAALCCATALLCLALDGTHTDRSLPLPYPMFPVPPARVVCVSFPFPQGCARPEGGEALSSFPSFPCCSSFFGHGHRPLKGRRAISYRRILHKKVGQTRVEEVDTLGEYPNFQREQEEKLRGSFLGPAADYP